MSGFPKIKKCQIVWHKDIKIREESKRTLCHFEFDQIHEKNHQRHTHAMQAGEMSKEFEIIFVLEWID